LRSQFLAKPVILIKNPILVFSAPKALETPKSGFLKASRRLAFKKPDFYRWRFAPPTGQIDITF
jgi:hypothetical protein